MSRHLVGKIDDVPTGKGREYVVAGRIIAMFNAEGTFYAMDGVCPHAGGPLAKGILNQRIVTCPWHGWQFDVANGKHCLNNHISHPHFPVTVEGPNLWIELPDQPG